MNLGPGPVFLYETLLSTRRWQIYAVRSFYVLLLLIGLSIVWSDTMRRTPIAPGGTAKISQMAELGAGFFYALTGIQIAVVMLAAPATAAGTICMDRARGTLLHMMVTDLTDAEIVLGKLGARLIPMFCWLACGIPVMALAALMGGIDFNALIGAFWISLTLCVLGCALAMFISVWAKKTHEVIMAVYMIEVLSLLSLPIWWAFKQWGGAATPPLWFQKTNPFYLAFEPYAQPGTTTFGDYLIFVFGGLAIATIFIIIMVVFLRRSIVKEAGRPGKNRKSHERKTRSLFPSLPSPTLDGNPVLWREWHRSRPSRLSRLLWAILLGTTWAAALWGAGIMLETGAQNAPNPLPFGYLFQIFLGLLFVSVIAPTTLSEERVRSSLDVLLSTPLATRKIVAGKWWGAFRWVLVLLPLPLFCGIFLAATAPDLPSYVTRMPTQIPFIPLTNFDRVSIAMMVPFDFLASGAMFVSLGLLIATWVARQGRAVAISVITYLAISVGWPILVSTLSPYNAVPLSTPADWANYENHRRVVNAICSLSPAFACIQTIEELLKTTMVSRMPIYFAQGAVALLKAVIAVGLFAFTVRTFDTRLGRISDDGRPQKPKPRQTKGQILRIEEESVVIGKK